MIRPESTTIFVRSYLYVECEFSQPHVMYISNIQESTACRQSTLASAAISFQYSTKFSVLREIDQTWKRRRIIEPTQVDCVIVGQ